MAGPGRYVGNDECLRCHQTEATAWQGSHHAHAMAPATEASVRGDFSGVEFEHDGVTSRLFRRDGRFFVRTDGPDGVPGEFEVQFTFGVDPLQQYLLELPGGRLQALTIAWDVARGRWFHLYPDDKTPPGDVLHWTGRSQCWSTMCAACHSTDVRKGYDAEHDRFPTTWSEVNVSCQACHGPGARPTARKRVSPTTATSRAPATIRSSCSTRTGTWSDARCGRATSTAPKAGAACSTR